MPPDDVSGIADRLRARNAPPQNAGISGIQTPPFQQSVPPVPPAVPTYPIDVPAFQRSSNIGKGGADSDLWDDYEERAAIMEFDGGMTRAEAEAAAWRDVFGEEKP